MLQSTRAKWILFGSRMVIILSYTMPSCSILCHPLLSYVILQHVILYYVILYYVILSYVILYYDILFYSVLFYALLSSHVLILCRNDIGLFTLHCHLFIFSSGIRSSVSFFLHSFFFLLFFPSVFLEFFPSFLGFLTSLNFFLLSFPP